MTTVLDFGASRITTNSREYGQDCAYDLLSLTYAVKEPGYMCIYLSNENPTAVEVYFDDFKVDHIKSPVVQMDDYYPFGLTFNSYQRENSVQNKFKFQGQEHVDDLNLGWDSFKWRNHQPDIGRFFNVDPLAEKYLYNSPYAFSENKVTSFVELEGLEAWDIKNKWNEENIAKYMTYVNKKADALNESGVKCTCEDFALTTLIDFASENGLPVVITNGSGTYNANSTEYTDLESYKNDVLTTTAAPDLQKGLNTNLEAQGVGAIDGAQRGDILLKRNDNNVATHVQVVSEASVDQVKIRQGNSGNGNWIPGASRIFGAGNPKSSTYTGTEVQSGSYDKRSGAYQRDGGSVTPNGVTKHNLERRTWAFYIFNVRNSIAK